ncbi:glycosyltransferase [Pseudoxanthomonas koreensis]|uniref:glycosyltransferase n=1 Tax=Pseudoxanthomonas koreensis TaxID=266061 RepID=UPI001390B5F3|nr:glycosyltransferase [Pseudoxanthomonas koreensis]KAF1695305.1 glycosyltransferase [Pseudoxanthomonas koreensis]
MTSPLLYISYDGMLEPLGQSQVLAYLERLAAGRPIHLLSFEKPEDWAQRGARDALAARIAGAGIHWHPRRYHKRPSAVATGWDIGIGVLVGLWLVLRHRIGIVHARSYVPAVMALALKRLAGVNFVFDMRGFWADERVDGGLWPRDGRMYRVAKWFERRFLLGADHVVSLTHAAVAEMQRFDYLQGRMPPVTVIPTCADLSRFAPIDGQRDPQHFTLGYVGSAGTWYLFDATVAAFRALQRLRPDARLLIVNRNEHALIRTKLQAGGIDPATVELLQAEPAAIPGLMARMDAAVFFIKPVFSKQASAPTKLGEFLGCGIPCLANTGVGDMAAILRQDRVGIAVDAMDDASLQQGITDLLALCADPGVRERCVASAQAHFSLEEGVARYRAIYQSLGSAR